MITLRVETITELISSVILWAKETNGEGVYAHSNDGGFISMRVSELMHEGMYYKSICFIKVDVPNDRRRTGLYSGLIRSIDDLNIFGVRWHDTVENRYLIERHSKRGYFKRDDSFFKIIGDPYPIDIQNRIKKRADDLKKKLMKGSNKPLKTRLLKQKRKEIS